MVLWIHTLALHKPSKDEWFFCSLFMPELFIIGIHINFLAHNYFARFEVTNSWCLDEVWFHLLAWHGSLLCYWLMSMIYDYIVGTVKHHLS